MKAVAYLRVSTEEQAEEGRSLQAQEKAIREFATRKGIELVKTFSEAESGFRPGVRKVFDQMMKYLEATKEIEAVVVWKIIRAARNRTDWATLTEKLRNGKGIFILSVTEQLPTTSIGALMGDISVSFGFWQAKVIGEQTSAGMQSWIEEGVWPSRAPLGYRNKPRSFSKQRGLGVEPDPVTAPIVKQMFELAATGDYTISHLREYALERNVKSCLGTTPTRHQIHDMLRSPFYYGGMVWKGKVYPGKHEPLVSESLWLRIQKILEDRCSNRGFGKKEFAFKGLMRCGNCESGITMANIKGRGGIYTYYWCCRSRNPDCPEGYMREEWLSDRLAEVLVPLRWPKETIERAYCLLKDLEGEKGAWAQTEIERLKRQQEILKTKLSQGMEKYLEGKIPENLWLEKSSEWNQELHRNEARIKELLDLGFQPFDLARSIIDSIVGIHKTYLKEKDRFKRGQILKNVTFNLFVTHEKVVPVYKKPFDLLAELGSCPFGRP